MKSAIQPKSFQCSFVVLIFLSICSQQIRAQEVLHSPWSIGIQGGWMHNTQSGAARGVCGFDDLNDWAKGNTGTVYISTEFFISD